MFETASALWAVVESVSGSPLAVTSSPSNSTLDFIADTWIGLAPLVENSIVELRTLDSAIETLPKIPSGNAYHPFFTDNVVIFDALSQSTESVKSIGDAFAEDLADAREWTRSRLILLERMPKATMHEWM